MAEKIQTEPAKTVSGESNDGNADVNTSERRLPRSIRFSDSEWKLIEKTAKERGMAAAELVRHAAVGFAKGKFSASPSGSLPTSHPEIAAQIERIYNGVYLLTTLKRDEMLARGREEEVERIIEDARKSRELIQESSV